jgi:hypothetical protein
MQTHLTIPCKVRLQAILEEKGISSVGDARLEEPCLRKKQMRDITSYLQFVVGFLSTCYFSDLVFQPGEPRCSCEIVESLQKQLKLACSGVKARVLKEQSTTGIKDGYTQHWIDQLLERAQTMKNEGLNVSEIEQDLSNWVDENKSLVTNKIFTLKGMWHLVNSGYLN